MTQSKMVDLSVIGGGINGADIACVGRAEDLLWRRTKHRLHLSATAHSALGDWFNANLKKAA